MEIHHDFSELFACLIDEKVEFVLVGAYALALHGVPRATGDLDIYVRPTEQNADAVLRALGTFGFDGLDLSREDFTTLERVVQLGFPPVRVDLLTSISGLTWDEAADSAETFRFGDLEVRTLGRDALIKNKRATGRTKDLADIEALGDGETG